MDRAVLIYDWFVCLHLVYLSPIEKGKLQRARNLFRIGKASIALIFIMILFDVTFVLSRSRPIVSESDNVPPSGPAGDYQDVCINSLISSAHYLFIGLAVLANIAAFVYSLRYLKAIWKKETSSERMHAK
jgi:hypothetical protein